jgi:uncharacterized protein YbjT (DUF2867 family)
VAKTILSYGATGVQGGPVARRLLEAGHTVRTVVRNPERAQSLQAMGLEVFQGDLGDPESLERASKGADAVFLILPLGGNPVEFAHNAIQAAKQADVGYLVLNTSGPTPKTPTGSPMMDYRLALEAELHDSGVPSVSVRPTTYMENLLGPWALPAIRDGSTVAYPVPGDHRVSWISAEDAAALCVAALGRPELAGQTFDVGGPEALTGARIAESFSRALGRAVRYEPITPEAFGGMMAQAFGPAMGAGATTAYRHTWAQPKDAMNIDMEAVLEHLPVKLTSLEDWVQAHREAF